MATDYKALGKRISNARKQAGITQEALGEQLNMTRKHLKHLQKSLMDSSYSRFIHSSAEGKSIRSSVFTFLRRKRINSDTRDTAASTM